jgi:methylated-DNA-[protein]-cysteine S-methyltransferase
MSRAYPTCREIEPELVAVGAGEASPTATDVVEAHVARCPACREELGRYRALDQLVANMRRAPLPTGDPALARAQLESRLADLKRRLIAFGVFRSPLGPILIARSEEGVSMVEYLESEAAAASHLARLAGVDAVEDEGQTQALYRDLLDYLDGRRTRLEWPLDLRLASSDFQRRVLQVTSRLPYGAVTSYGHIAREVGEPRATRAVAQALRRNPLPIVIPCHRVIGSSGDLTGYAGNKVGLKQRLLTLEGVPVAGDGALHVERQTMYVRYQTLSEYCLPTCGSLPSTPLAELTLFGSRQRAEAAGLTPCSDCRPDLHPLPVPAGS